MKIQKTHLVAFSPCGGTLACLRAMLPGLGFPLSEHDLTLPSSRKELLAFGPDEVVIMGFPVYGGRLPRNCGEVFARLRGENTPAVPVAVYGNRHYEDALLEIQNLAVERGFVPFAGIAAVADHVMEPSIAAHRPDVDDKELLASFAEKAMALLQAADSPEAFSFVAPGETPYRKPPSKPPFHPNVLDNCIRCGACAVICPAGAVPEATPNTTVPENCLACTACVRVCPQQARVMEGEPLDTIRAWLRGNCTERRTAEFFA